MRSKIIVVVVSVFLFTGAGSKVTDIWGFYGHRLINKTAVFTLPVDLIPLYKSNIDFITEHAVDPDKRRYAAKLEAVRHYIDLDIWGTPPFDNVPRNFTEALVTFSEVHVLRSENKDTIKSWNADVLWKDFFNKGHKQQVMQEVSAKLFQLLEERFLPLPDSWLPKEYDSKTYELIFVERFSEYGILPYHLSMYQHRLVKAFKDKEWPLAIRLSTEMGHYLSDAHVPLHTTQNYNGQMTGQDGIHAFWESRIPELFAETEYDFFVGRAKYIEDTDAFFWNVVLDSHRLVEAVLSEELELRHTFDSDKQYCFDERGAATSRLECKEYARAYQDAMAGMVEQRMRQSIQALGSIWYTAWVDAGRPNIDDDKTSNSIDTLVMLQSDSLALGN